MALYPKAIQKPIPPGPTDPRIKPRVVILHVAVSEQPSLFGYFNGPSGGVESHFYIRRDGTTEQYRDTSWQADANTDANDFAISIETQGMESGEWTPAQLDAIKALILWCHETHDIPLVRCMAWDGFGIGYHTLFPGRWDKRGASCPGPDRKLQFNQIITPWLATAGTEWDEMATKDEIKDALREILKEDGLVASPMFASNPTVAPVTAWRYAMEWSLQARDRALDPQKVAEAVASISGGAVTDEQLERVLRTVLGSVDNPK